MTTTRALLVVAIAACTKSVGGPIALDDLEHAYDLYFCASLARCGLMTDVPLCESLHPNRFGGFGGLFTTVEIQAAKAGGIAYDPRAAEDCLAGFFSTCLRDLDAQPRGEPAACDRMFVASGGSGDACATNAECVSQVCVLTTCTGSCCQGTCTGDPAPPPRPALGQSCVNNTACIASYCETPADICVPYRPYGVTCDSTPQCEPGLRCDNGVCLNLAGTGDPCTSNDDCQRVSDFCELTTFTCKHVGLAGAACTDATQCGTFYQCDQMTMTCTLGARLGESCAASGYCIDASACDQSTFTCVPLAADGEPCQSSFQCASDFCDTSITAFPGTCAPLPVCF